VGTESAERIREAGRRAAITSAATTLGELFPAREGDTAFAAWECCIDGVAKMGVDVVTAALPHDGNENHADTGAPSYDRLERGAAHATPASTVTHAPTRSAIEAWI
jgi:hypothetical protein